MLKIFSILVTMLLHWNRLHFHCDLSTRSKMNLIIVKSESKISSKGYQVRASHNLGDAAMMPCCLSFAEPLQSVSIIICFYNENFLALWERTFDLNFPVGHMQYDSYYMSHIYVSCDFQYVPKVANNL